jgi:hypothetical protein
MECKKNLDCSIFQYNKANGICEIKGTSKGTKTLNNDIITGPVECDFIKSKFFSNQ